MIRKLQLFTLLLAVTALAGPPAFARVICLAPPANDNGKSHGRVPDHTVDVDDELAQFLIDVGAATDGPC